MLFKKNATFATTSTTFLTPTLISIFAPIISSWQPLSKSKSNLKSSACITISKRRPLTLDIFASTNIRCKCHKKYAFPFNHSLISVSTRITTNSQFSISTPTTITTKHWPKLKMQDTSSQNPTLKHSTSITKNELENTTTSRTTTIQTAVPALMNNNTCLLPRFCKLTTSSSSTTIHLSSSIKPLLIFLDILQELQQSGL